MKAILLVALIFLIPLSSVPYLEQTNAQIEPSPPSIPNPEPEPIPIPKKEPEPIQEPFPGLSDEERLAKLIKENEELKSENSKLESQVTNLEIQKNFLQTKVDELTKKLEDLNAVVREQINVIMSLVTQLKETIFDGIIPSLVKV